MLRYYISTSLNFPLSLAEQKKIVLDAGGINVRIARQFGWNNQPGVITFSATVPIEKRVYNALPIGYSLRLKDW